MNWREEKKGKTITNIQTTTEEQITVKIEIGTYRVAKIGKVKRI